MCLTYLQREKRLLVKICRQGSNVIKLLRPILCNKLMRLNLGLTLASPFSLVQYVWVWPGAYPGVEHPEHAAFRLAPAVFANIRLGCKGLQGINTQAF